MVQDGFKPQLLAGFIIGFAIGLSVVIYLALLVIA